MFVCVYTLKYVPKQESGKSGNKLMNHSLHVPHVHWVTGMKKECIKDGNKQKIFEVDVE